MLSIYFFVVVIKIRHYIHERCLYVKKYYFK